MKFIRCKCGKMTGWTSYGGGQPCVGCSACNTTLETRPELHKAPAPHEYEERYDAHGGTHFACRVCGRWEHEEAQKADQGSV